MTLPDRLSSELPGSHPVVAISYLQTEWWTKHLATALQEISDVQAFSMPEGCRPGYATDADLCTLLEPLDVGNSFYIGSFAQLYKGLTTLPLRTGVWADFPPTDDYYLDGLSLFDHVFASSVVSARRLLSVGFSRVSYLPFAVDTSLHNDPNLAKDYEVAFVGNLDLPPTRQKRLALLANLEQRYRMNDYRTPVYGDAMMNVYNRTKIVVNIPWSGSGAFNMRTFEAMAAGALLLTQDVGTGSHDLFQPGVHLDYYTDEADLIGKIDYYLGHEQDRLRIAQTGMQEVLTKHTYQHRAATVLETMKALPMPALPRAVSQKTIRRAYAKFYSRARQLDLLADQGGVLSSIMFAGARKTLRALAMRRHP
jgi:hypothetical protein